MVNSCVIDKSDDKGAGDKPIWYSARVPRFDLLCRVVFPRIKPLEHGHEPRNTGSVC